MKGGPTRWTNRHLIRAFVALAALIAVPTALGSKPTKTVVTAGPSIISAGEGCAFDVEETVPEGTTFTVTEFGDGSRVVTYGNSEPTLTNLETGTTFLQKTRGQITERFDPQTNELRFTTSGRIFISFLPGDQGPFGEVDEPGLLLSIIGHQVATLDLDANVITSYSLRGQAIDICAALAD